MSSPECAREAAGMMGNHSSVAAATATATLCHNQQDKLWCLCGGVDDGRLMLHCE